MNYCILKKLLNISRHSGKPISELKGELIKSRLLSVLFCFLILLLLSSSSGLRLAVGVSERLLFFLFFFFCCLRQALRGLISFFGVCWSGPSTSFIFLYCWNFLRISSFLLQVLYAFCLFLFTFLSRARKKHLKCSLELLKFISMFSFPFFFLVRLSKKVLPGRVF